MLPTLAPTHYILLPLSSLLLIANILYSLATFSLLATKLFFIESITITLPAMAPVPAMDASTSVASPLTPSKKENAYSNHSAINEHIKPAKNHELSRINESSNDSQPDPKGSWRSWRRGDGLQPWENEIVRSSEVQRKANVAQLYFLNHYFDNLRYLADRKARLARFQESTRARGLLPEAPDAEPSAEYLKERNSYFGRERVLLRKRRTKLRVDQFHIITQVGAGGYGEVFLARKRDTGEICALKRLKKRILVKMDEGATRSYRARYLDRHQDALAGSTAVCLPGS